MLQRIGYTQQVEIEAFLKQHAINNLAVLSSLQNWSMRYAHTALNLVAYVHENQIIAVSALYRDGRWLPFFTDPTAVHALIEDHAHKPLSWVIGAAHVLRPLLIALQNRGLCWDHDEQGSRCCLDTSNWHPHPSPHVRQATEEDLDDVARLRMAFDREYFGASASHLNHSTFRDFVRPYIKQGTYLGITDHQVVSMVMIEAKTDQGVKLGAVYTNEKYRNRGWAKAVVSAACNDHVQDTALIVLDVRNDNHPARRAYQALGFIPQSDYRMVRLQR